MALNFPTDTSAPYIDPISGLKYVFNSAVGAWEAAIQPPVVNYPSAPDLEIEGFLWYDTTNSELYIYNNGAWIATTGSQTTTIHVSDQPPGSPVNGSMWWDSVNGRMYIYYVDPDSSQWIDAAPTVSASGAAVFSAATAPAAPTEGDLWFNTINNTLNVYTAGQWVTTQNAVAGVASMTGTAPITVTGDASAPVVGIASASTSAEGAVRIANQAEVNAGSLTNVALSPGGLSNGIENYLPVASETVSGVVELADASEVQAGTDDTKAVSPASLNASLAALGLASPVGSIIIWPLSTPPAGYLECDGSDAARGTYADLYAVVGDNYGVGDGASTFGLPDLRGVFVRGLDNGRGQDAGRVIGSYQSDEIASHTHSGTAGDAGTLSDGGGGRANDLSTYTTDATGGSETRPKNVAMMYCIKF